MTEKMPFKVAEGKSAVEELTEHQVMELSIAKEFMLENAPEGWESEVNEMHVHTLRQEIVHWDYDELIAYCQRLDVWEDPTKTKAVIDVIASRVTQQ
jgi:hypothetical protein